MRTVSSVVFGGKRRIRMQVGREVGEFANGVPIGFIASKGIGGKAMDRGCGREEGCVEGLDRRDCDDGENDVGRKTGAAMAAEAAAAAEVVGVVKGDVERLE